MKKAGSIIGLIAGIFGIIAGFATLFMGGLAGAFNASGSGTVVGLGWGGIGFSFLVIIFSAISMSAKTRVPPSLLIVSSLGGIVLGGTLVAIVLALGLIGGVLALFGNYQKVAAGPLISDQSSTSSSSKSKVLVIGAIVLVLLFAMVAYKSGKGNSESVETSENQQILDLENVEASALKPYGELEQIYALGGNYTDIQRDNKTEEIKGSVVDWSLQVYDVKKTDDGYKIQTSGRGLIGTFINLTVRDAEEKAFVENLKTGDLIRVKAIIEDVSFRSLNLSPAVLYKKTEEVSQITDSQNSDVVNQEGVASPEEVPVNETTSAEVAQVETPIEEPKITANEEVSKPSFDCTKASTNIEKLICSNPELGNWDMKVSTAYSQAMSTAPQEVKSSLKAQQQEWIKSRNKCISSECLISVHEKRHSELAPWEYEEH